MTQHTELIARLRGLTGTLKSGAWSTIAEAADALQAMERVPMTRVERRSAFLALDNPSSYDDFMTGLDTAEAHHNITPPESKG